MTMHFINRLEPELRASVQLKEDTANPENWQLEIKLIYHGEPAGSLSFRLRGYGPEEAQAVAADIRHQPVLMREIDLYLAGGFTGE